jgi:hypothetical protein
MTKLTILFAAASLAMPGMAVRSVYAAEDVVDPGALTGSADADRQSMDERPDLDPRENVRAIRVFEDELPAPVREGILQARGDRGIQQISRITVGDRTFYRVRLSGDRYLRLTEAGTVINEGQLAAAHQRVRWTELPREVRNAITDEHDRFDVGTITEVRSGDFRWYVVEVLDGEPFRVDQDGNMMDSPQQPIYLGERGDWPEAQDPGREAHPEVGNRELNRQRTEIGQVPEAVRSALNRRAVGREVGQVQEHTFEVKRYSVMLENRHGDRRLVWLDEQGNILREEDIGRRP